MIDAVIKLGGRCLEQPEALRALAAEIASLVREGRWIALVHGGGTALDAHLAGRGFQNEKRQGIRITPPEIVREIVSVLGGGVNKGLVASLCRAGVRAVGLTGVDGGTVRAEHLTFPDFDPGRVGRITGGDAALLKGLLARGFVPVFASVAADAEGRFLNVNADSFAAGLARVAGAKRLVLLTDVTGVLDSGGKRIRRLDAAEAEALICGGTVRDGMIPKLRAALAAAREAGCEVVIASFQEAGVLRKAISGGPAGTVLAPGAAAPGTLR